jgi:hypothetical protein
MHDCPYPADPDYLLDMLHSIDTGRIDPERSPRIPRQRRLQRERREGTL